MTAPISPLPSEPTGTGFRTRRPHTAPRLMIAGVVQLAVAVPHLVLVVKDGSQTTDTSGFVGNHPVQLVPVAVGGRLLSPGSSRVVDAEPGWPSDHMHPKAPRLRLPGRRIRTTDGAAVRRLSAMVARLAADAR